MCSHCGIHGGELTSFIGRRREIGEVRRSMTASRLVTLTGVGGVGKTRLALRVAQDARRAFSDGVAVAELADVSEPELVSHAVAQAVHVRHDSTQDVLAAIVGHLRERQLLLVIDNCEHLLEPCADLIAELLASTDRLHILATSREPLGVLGEHTWPVPPLSIPDLANVAPARGGYSYGHEAVELFQERAAAVIPGFALEGSSKDAAAELCQRLDGLPLAIELAAVRIRVLPIEEILNRLKDRYSLLKSGNRGGPARHQTLWAAVDWSFELCSAAERTMWSRVSVFNGGFDMQAAEAVCTDEDISEADVLDLITGLIDKSVVVRDGSGPGARFRLLETIKDYGRRKLSANGEEEQVRRKHRDYYLRVAEESEKAWFGPDQVMWRDRLQSDQANLWAALEFCLTRPGEETVGLRMAAALCYFWNACGHLRDGRYWLGRALKTDPQPSRERAKVLWVNGWDAMTQGDNSTAQEYFSECVKLGRELDDPTAIAYANQFSGSSKQFMGQLDEAKSLLEDAVARHKGLGTLNSLSVLATTQLAFVSCLIGELDRAIALCEEARDVCERYGERWTLSWTLWVLGLARWTRQDYETASEVLEQALEAKWSLNDRLGVSSCVELLGWMATERDDCRRAARLFGAGRRMWEAIGDQLFGSATLIKNHHDYEERVRDALGVTSFAQEYRQGAEMMTESAIAFALKREVHPQSTRSPQPQQTLTRREQEVCQLVAEGLSNKEIADRLVISRRTAEGHVEHILVKLGFTSRTQVAAWIAKNEE